MSPTSTHNGTCPEADTAAERCLMAELSILRGRRHYFYDGYSYDCLSDAVAYAQFVRGQTRQPGASSLDPMFSAVTG